MNLVINQINSFTFKVAGDGIDAEARYYGNYSNNNQVKGKGSRKFKDIIFKAIQDYKEVKMHEKVKQQEKEYKQKRQKLLASYEYNHINLINLYEVVTMKKAYDSPYYEKHDELLTGVEILQDYNNVIEIYDHDIVNTDFYCLGNDSHYERLSKVDPRFLIIGMAKRVYITGLALKELLSNGLNSYNSIRKATYNEVDILKNYASNSGNNRLITDFTSDNYKIEVAEKIKNEIIRAEKGKLQKQKTRYTSDNKPIKKAFFTSKPCNMKEVKSYSMATYDDYIISESIELEKEEFEMFYDTLDMSLLNTDFTGGTSSTYKTDESIKEFYNLEEIDQINFIANSYRLALEVTCKDYNNSILIDPQGHNYARYVAIKHR